MKITQENYNVTYAELKGFEQALQLVAMAEKYPTDEDKSMSLPPLSVAQNLSMLSACLEVELKPFKTDLEKLSKKYEKDTDEKGVFLEGKDKEKKKYNEDSIKLLETKKVAMLPVLPPLEDWDDFNVSYRAIALLSKLFKKPKEETK